MDIFLPILIIAVLILLNGLFVAAEFAIIGTPRSAIERRAADGHRVARLVQEILQDPRRQDRYIATAQLGITLASLGLGMYGEHVLAEWFANILESLGATRWIAAHALASILSVTFLTYFHIVVGEMVPKSLALMHAERVALWITRPILWVKTLLFPLVIGLNGLGNGILKLMGIERQLTTAHYYTPEELQFIIRESEEGGVLRAESGKMLRELFEFSDLTAGEVMVPRVHVIGLPLGATPQEMAALLRTEPHTRYPVYEGDLDHIVGIVHIKDILNLLLQRQALSREKVRPTAFVPETAELDSVLRAMHEAQTHLVIVMDEHGGTAGITSIEDLCAEVVGEIEDGDEIRPDLYYDAAGRLHVPGTMRLDEVGESLGISLEHEEVDTVSGLVLTLLKRPARLGDLVLYNKIRFEVTAVDGRGVKECMVTLLNPQPPEEETAE